MTKKFDLFDILILLSIIFIGTDVWSINLLVNIRLIQVFYLVVVFYMIIKDKYRLYINKYFVLFLLSSSLSVLFSISILNSLLYYFWILYDFIILIPIFYCYVKEKGPKQFLVLIKYTFRIILGLILVQYILDGVLHIELPFLSSQHHMGVTRPALWFYEPSYLASFMLIYLSISAYEVIINKNIRYIFDLLATILSLVIITSTTGFLGIVLVLGLCFILFIAYAKTNKQRLFASLTAVVSVIVIFLGVRFFLPNVYFLFIDRIFSSGLVSAAGGRITEYNFQINAFVSSPIVGVGLDAYGAFIGNVNSVATNITLELLACSGILGAIAFYSLIVVPCYNAFFGKNKKSINYSKQLCLALFVLIVILQANQNYMRLYLWMMIVVSFAGIEYELDIAKKNDIDSSYMLY